MVNLGEPLKASLEAVTYRGKSRLYEDLRLIYTDVLDGDTEEAMDRLTMVIHKHTGIDISFTIYESPYCDAAIYFLPINLNAVTNSADIKKYVGKKINLDHLKPLLNGQKGWTTSKGEVKGFFRKLPCRLVLSTAMLLPDRFTPEELAAITLHEVGHVYGYFDTMGRTLGTSLAIAYTQETLAKTESLKDRTHVIEHVAKVLQLDHVNSKELADPTQANTVEYVLIRDTVDKLQTDIGNDKLFNGEVEYMADSYAVRSGGSKALLSALMKLYKLDHNAQLRSRSQYFTVEGLKVATFIFGATTPTLMPIAGLLSGLAIASQKNASYLSRNTPIERVDAVRSDLIQLLKDRRLPADLRESLLTDVRYVAAIREQLAENRSLITYLWLSLSPKRRKHYQQIKLQKEISNLVNNELFVKAAQLRDLKVS